MYYDEEFKSRLTKLRLANGASARDMSLSIGQNPGYINNIECGKALPSLSAFFYICDFLNIKPKEFFDITNNNPEKINQIAEDMKHLNNQQLDIISLLVKELRANN